MLQYKTAASYDGKADIDFQKLNERFGKEYAFLYDHQDRVEGYAEALAAAEAFLAEHGEVVGAFAQVRGDYLTSDRELVAFIMTLDAILREDTRCSD